MIVCQCAFDQLIDHLIDVVHVTRAESVIPDDDRILGIELQLHEIGDRLVILSSLGFIPTYRDGMPR